MALTLSGDDGVAGVNGSATTPAIQGTDTNTGLTFGTDTVNVVTGGSTRATVDSSGRVGIGFTDPSAPLDIQTNSGGEALRIRAASGVAASQVLFRNSGNSATHFRISAESGGTELNSIGSAYLTVVTNGSERGRIAPDGRILYGTTNTINDCRINLKGDFGTNRGVAIETNQSSADMVFFRTSSGNAGIINSNGTSTSYGTSSDYRLKENITTVTDGITRLQQLQPKRFNFLADPNKTVDGFIAHEVQTVVPEAITGERDEIEVWKEGQELPDGVSVGDNKLDEDGNTIPVYQCIDQSKLVPLLTAALQEAISKIEALETRVAQLEGGAS